jgi:AcrR family transcriptional regulator
VSETTRTSTPDTRTRIVAAGIRCIVRRGIADATMSAIAEEAEVSKALLHYHFVDRARLFGEIVRTLGRRLEARERASIERLASESPVDALWGWVGSELARGELRALLTIGTVADEPVQSALGMVHDARRQHAGRTVTTLFERLSIVPRVPIQVIADASVVFVDGLALDGLDPSHARLGFDVFWLAMLGLGE